MEMKIRCPRGRRALCAPPLPAVLAKNRTIVCGPGKPLAQRAASTYRSRASSQQEPVSDNAQPIEPQHSESA